MFKNINVKKIVLEEINKYFKTQLISEGLYEDEMEDGSDEEFSKPKLKTDKQKEIQRKIEKARKREGKTATTNNAKSAIDFLKHPCINASKVLERATGLDPTSASSEAAKIANEEEGWEVSENLVNTINDIKAELGS